MSNINVTGKFVLASTEQIPIPSPDLTKAIHQIAHITSGLRDYVLLQDMNNPHMIWLNELMGSTLYEIEDDNLFHDLYAFLTEKGLIKTYVDTEHEAERKNRLRP